MEHMWQDICFLVPHSSPRPDWRTYVALCGYLSLGFRNYHKIRRFPSLPSTLLHKSGQDTLWCSRRRNLLFSSFEVTYLFPLQGTEGKSNIWIRIYQSIHWREGDQRKHSVWFTPGSGKLCCDKTSSGLTRWWLQSEWQLRSSKEKIPKVHPTLPHLCKQSNEGARGLDHSPGYSCQHHPVWEHLYQLNKRAHQ